MAKSALVCKHCGVSAVSWGNKGWKHSTGGRCLKTCAQYATPILREEYERIEREALTRALSPREAAMRAVARAEGVES